MQFSPSSSPADGVLERTFTVGEVPGVLWTPDPLPAPAPLVLMGHPGGMHTRVPALVARAHRLVTEWGFAAAAIDLPGHGARARSTEDAAWVDRIRRARSAGEPLGPIVSAFNGDLAERAVPEWRAVLDGLLELPEVTGPVGYSGMTLATEVGIRLVAAEPRIGAAILGGAFASDALVAAARAVTVPVQYLVAWDDPEIDRESSLTLFDAFGSAEKSMHANQGTHRKVPLFEGDDGARFLTRHLR